MSKATKPKRRRAVLRIGKETYGTKPIEEAFREALAPYFTETGNGDKKAANE